MGYEFDWFMGGGGVGVGLHVASLFHKVVFSSGHSVAWRESQRCMTRNKHGWVEDYAAGGQVLMYFMTFIKHDAKLVSMTSAKLFKVSDHGTPH